MKRTLIALSDHRVIDLIFDALPFGVVGRWKAKGKQP
jgi:hypothetical protein